MASRSCDACREDVPIAGGIANIWNTDPTPSGGMTLEFADGTEHFLCFACIDALPEDPAAADVEALK